MKISTLTSEGMHDEEKATVDEAIEYIKKQIKERSLWLFLDGKPVAESDINPGEIAHASEIIMMSELTGG